MREHTWSLLGLTVRDLTVTAPLDHGDPASTPIEVFARVVTKPGGEDKPYLVYLQGGPGSEAPRPTEATNPSWMGRALEDHQVVMLDQRGTGRSTPVGPDTALPAGAIDGAATLREASVQQRVDYLQHFRADAIVEDAEIVRKALGVDTWGLLGQSFGGFCTLRYLSAHADSVSLALFTGGLPCLGEQLDNVYTHTWHGMAARSEAYYQRFEGDREVMRQLAEKADDGRLLLPDGQKVGVERLRRIGHLLGASGGQERLHYLLDMPQDSPAFAHDLASLLPFGGRNPIYAVLHESCWADGFATRWAADRTMPHGVKQDPTLLGGEHVPRSIFAEDPELAMWAETADALAEHVWPRLYDEKALAAVDVPAAAAVYYDDAYVPREWSMEVVELVPSLKAFVTSEFEHNGLRASGDGVFEHILDLAQGRRLA